MNKNVMSKRAKKRAAVFKWFLVVGVIIMVGALGFSTYLYQQSRIEEHGVELTELPGYRGVHWHARLEMWACGRKLRLPLNRGTPLLHTHKDPEEIHVEGLIKEGEPVTLGQFMDAVGVPFTSTNLFEFQNDHGCPDEGSDRLRLLVNGVESDFFRDQPIGNSDNLVLIYD